MTSKRVVLFFCVLVTLNAKLPGSGDELSANRRTSPQIVAGLIPGGFNYMTTLSIQSKSQNVCNVVIRYHQGAGRPVTNPPRTDGQSSGSILTRVLPPFGKTDLELTGPAPDQFFIGAATIDTITQHCVSNINIQTLYSITTSTGQFDELFSFGDTPQVGINSCVRAPVTFDPDNSDGRTRFPGFASVSFESLPTVDRCMDLWGANGNQIGQTICSQYDGSHSAMLLSQFFPLQAGFTGSWRVCFPGLFPSGTAPTIIQTLFLDVVTNAGRTQLATASGKVENSKLPNPNRCIPGLNTLCLNGDRFKVEASWRTSTAFGNATVSKTVDGAGLLFFSSPSNTELLVKVLNGCQVNNNFWVFAAGDTTAEYMLTVTDTKNGTQKTYSNPLGMLANAVTDRGAFATCP